MSLIVEGASEKVSQFTMPLKSIYAKKMFVLMNIIAFFENKKLLKQK
jgi:hypothetical protein